MRCDVCGSNDSVFFIKPDGSGGELRMCKACAVASGYASAGEGLGARFESLIGEGSGPAVVSCPACGWTAELIRSSGRLGCTDCVNIFRRDILSAIKRSGGHGPYDGKVPRIPAVQSSVEESVAVLSGSLERAIRSEDFEAAAVIRDRLRAVSGKSTS